MDDMARAAEVLGSATDVALACHLNPDADALGSMLGLAAFLRRRGTATVCSFPNEPLVMPRWAAFLPGSEDLVEVSDFPDAPAVMVTCDCASFDRLGPLGRAASNAGELIWIDHHRSNDGLGIDPLDRSGGVIHVRDGLSPDRRDGRPDAGRDRRMPLRRARHRHGTLPVRGHHA